MDRICLKNMIFYGYHGVMPEEQRLGQRFSIDAELRLPLGRASRTDALEDTVNYAEVYELIRQVTEEERYALIERLAGEIGRRVLARFPLLDSIAVTVHKPSAPVPGPLGDVAVTVETERRDG